MPPAAQLVNATKKYGDVEALKGVSLEIASGEVVAAVHVHGPSYGFPPPGRDAGVGRLVVTTAGRIGRTLRQAAG